MSASTFQGIIPCVLPKIMEITVPGIGIIKVDLEGRAFSIADSRRPITQKIEWNSDPDVATVSVEGVDFKVNFQTGALHASSDCAIKMTSSSEKCFKVSLEPCWFIQSLLSGDMYGDLGVKRIPAFSLLGLIDHDLLSREEMRFQRDPRRLQESESETFMRPYRQ